MSSLQAQEVELQNIRRLGEEILSSCHPDSIITLKSWISVTKTRYEEVSVSYGCIQGRHTKFWALGTRIHCGPPMNVNY